LRHRNLTLCLIAALAVSRVLYIVYGPFDVSPDEAHYWEWSRRLDLSYYSKGPGVAYVIAFFTSILGPTELGIRLGAVVFSSLTTYLIYLIGRDVFKSEPAGSWGALLVNVTPIFSIGAILMTTDVLFIFFWVLAVYCLARALNGRTYWWYLSGLVIGLGFLCKYTMIFMYFSLFLLLVFSKQERRWFLRPEPYIMGLISLIAVTPVIYWNISHGQVTIRHTMGQAHLGSGGLSISSLGDFFGSQAALATPLIFLGLVYGLARCAVKGWREAKSGLLLVFFAGAPLFLFFAIKSLHAKVQANWAVAAYAAAFPAALWAIEGFSKGRVRALKAATIVMAVAATLIAYFPWTLGAFGASLLRRPPYNRVTGWAELGENVSRRSVEMAKEGPFFIASDTYQITSELALYTKGNPVVYNVVTGGRRMNQYDLWPGYFDLKGYNALYVKGGNAGAGGEFMEAFERCGKEAVTLHWGGAPLKDFTVFRCYGFKGMERPKEYETY